MPLSVARIPTDLAALKKASDKFLIFYSSVVDGKLWCPDCVRIENLVKETFEPADAPSAAIVYVGDRPSWKTPANPFRHAFNVQSVPTIIRLKDGEEEARLVDDEIRKESLTAFAKDSIDAIQNCEI